MPQRQMENFAFHCVRCVSAFNLFICPPHPGLLPRGKGDKIIASSTFVVGKNADCREATLDISQTRQCLVMRAK